MGDGTGAGCCSGKGQPGAHGTPSIEDAFVSARPGRDAEGRRAQVYKLLPWLAGPANPDGGLGEEAAARRASANREIVAIKPWLPALGLRRTGSTPRCLSAADEHLYIRLKRARDLG